MKKLFGGINLTWPKLIIFSVIMGVYTTLMALLVPDGNSFHDIVATVEWWILPAILIIVNCKKPLEAALKTFVFFLISQPLIYLLQVPYSQMGWGLFGYYPYWFKITLVTFPGAFLGWYITKDKWYSGVILSVITSLLAILGVGFVRNFIENPPNHLITTIYCFGIIPVFILFILKDKIPRLIATGITIVAMLIVIGFASVEPFESYQTDVITRENITLVGEPYVFFWSGTGKGHVEIIKYDDEGTPKYTFKLIGEKGKDYRFSISDDSDTEYYFNYHFDKDQQTVILTKE